MNENQGGKGAEGKNVDGAGAERRTKRELSDPSQFLATRVFGFGGDFNPCSESIASCVGVELAKRDRSLPRQTSGKYFQAV